MGYSVCGACVCVCVCVCVRVRVCVCVCLRVLRAPPAARACAPRLTVSTHTDGHWHEAGLNAENIHESSTID